MHLKQLGFMINEHRHIAIVPLAMTTVQVNEREPLSKLSLIAGEGPCAIQWLKIILASTYNGLAQPLLDHSLDLTNILGSHETFQDVLL